MKHFSFLFYILKGETIMNTQAITRFIKSAQAVLSKHSPEILTGIGIAGMITTTVLAVKATPKAIKLIEAKKEEEHVDKLTHVETVKATWKCYIPAVVTCVTSVACLIGASSVNAKRNAALLTAYNLSTTALSEYKEKVVETIGEEKEKTVRDAIAKDRINKTPVSKSEVVVTPKGNTLCYESTSGRYFKSDIEQIKKSVNEINRRMLSDMYISLNEFYDELGLDHTSIGEELGWHIDDGYIELDFSSLLADDGTPCLAVDYITPPRYNYTKYY